MLSSQEFKEIDDSKKIVSFSQKNENENEKTTKICKSFKEKEKRVITKTKKWNKYYIDYDKHYNILLFLKNQEVEEKQLETNEFKIMQTDALLLQNQISIKLNGYKSQDLKKNKFKLSDFVDINYVIEKLIECNLKCFYCKDKCLLLYENVRDSKQWSLERIDNSIGHDKNNVVIACLSCNIKRKIMNCEKFIFSNQCKNIIKIGELET
jgi:hypothetical protein